MASSSRRPKDSQGNASPEMGDLSQRLDDLKGRIASEERQREAVGTQPVSYGDTSGYAKGYRLITEFAAGPLVGGLIGFGLDKLLGILPVLTVIFLLLGFGAGFLNLARAAGRTSRAQERLNNNPPPQVAFDDEEED